MRSLLAFSDHPARNFFAFAPAARPERGRRALGPAVFGFRSAGLQPGSLAPFVPPSRRLAGYAVANSRRGAVRRGARSSNPRVHSGLAEFPLVAGFDHETFSVVGSYSNIGTRANMAVVCRAGGENDL
jgi:hypothetical protein